MISLVDKEDVGRAHVARLASLSPLTHADLAALDDAALNFTVVGARREITNEDEPASCPRLLLHGWAAHVREFKDGRRQILHVFIAGDLIDYWSLVPAKIVALTDVYLAACPVAGASQSGLGRAYALSAAVTQSYLFRQIARLGRLDAFERTADFLLELEERLRAVGRAGGDSFELPLTQETLADCLGLTNVHVNRMLQQMRREGLIEISGSRIRFLDAERLRSIVQVRSPKVRRETRKKPLSIVGATD